MMHYEAFRDALLALAKAHGAEAETYYVEDDSFEVCIENREVDTYSVAHGRGLELRVQKDGHDGYAYTELFEEPETLVLRALANASVISVSDTHPMNGPQVYPYIPEQNDSVLGLSAEKIIELARVMEQAVLAADPRVKRVSFNTLHTGCGTVRIANTLGLRAERMETRSFCRVFPILESGGESHDDTAYRINEETADVAGCAREAVHRAACQFGGEPVASGKYRVLFTGEAMSELLSAFSPMFSADSVQSGLSVLAGKEGQPVCGKNITIIDDPFYPRYPRAFDAEGTPSAVTQVIEAGVVSSFLHNLKTAKKAGNASTSNASRVSAAATVGIAPSQLYIVPGNKTCDDLVTALGNGLIIRSQTGLHAGVNPVTGEFSLLSKGAFVENGKIVRAVERIIVSGNFLGMLSDVMAIGDKLKFAQVSSVCGAPDLLVGALTVAGK